MDGWASLQIYCIRISKNDHLCTLAFIDGLYIPTSKDLKISDLTTSTQYPEDCGSLNLSGTFQHVQQHKAVKSLEWIFSLCSENPYFCPLQYMCSLNTGGPICHSPCDKQRTPFLGPSY